MNCEICKSLCKYCKYKVVMDAIIEAKTKKAKLELLNEFLDKETAEDDKTLL